MSKPKRGNIPLNPMKQQDSSPIEIRPKSRVSVKRLNKVGPLREDLRKRSIKPVETVVNTASATDINESTNQDVHDVHEIRRQYKRQMVYSFLNAYFNFPLIFIWLPAVMLSLISGYALHLGLFHMAQSDTRRAKRLNIACLLAGKLVP